MIKKNIFKFLILTFILFAIPNITFAQENLKRKTYVNDYADILDEKEEKKLTETITDYIEKYELDIAIVTTNTSYLYTTERFANYFYDLNKMGMGKDNSGILLVIDMQNREYYILTNGFVHQLITDARVEHILDVMETDMVDGNYYNASSSFLKQIDKYYKYHNYGPPFLWIGAFIAAIIIAFILLNKEKNKLKLINDALNANYYFGDKEIENKIDTLTNTRTRVIHHSSSSSGGSRGGGGGGSRGGGGRSF